VSGPGSGEGSGRRADARDARAAGDPAPGRAPHAATIIGAIVLGTAYAAMVVALLLLGHAGRGFIYQGF
jgi:hypothetical protein